MSKLISWIVMVVLAVPIIVFCTVNGQEVAFDLFPYPDTVALPVFVPALVMLVFGFLLGGLVAWARGGRVRDDRRRKTFALQASNRDVAVLRQKLAKYEKAERRATIPPPPADAA